MTHTITTKDQSKRIVLITVSDPINARTEASDIMKELETMLGTLTKTVYVIYDIRDANISFSDIVTGVSSGVARPISEFEKQLAKDGRVILVGTGTIVSVGAKTMSRFSPQRPFTVCKTVEEALEYAQAELAKERS